MTNDTTKLFTGDLCPSRNAKQENTYQNKISQILEQLSLYSNNFHIIQNVTSVISLKKDENGLIVRDQNGQILISANSKGVSSSVSYEIIDSIAQLIHLDYQQKQVEAIAPILKKYLELNNTNKIDRDDISLFFAPQTESIYFQYKKQPVMLSAVLIGGKWQNLITNISNHSFLSI